MKATCPTCGAILTCRNCKRKPFPPKNKNELNYGFRRVLFDMYVGAKVLLQFKERTFGRDFSAKEAAKFAGLMVARNLNDFFFGQQNEKKNKDDIVLSDFNLTWTASKSAELSKDTKNRIHKLYGHIVSSRPKPFTDDREVVRVISPLVEVAGGFIRECGKQGRAKATGNVPKYRRRLNGILKSLNMLQV